MVEGLKFGMPADELRAHLESRIQHHKSRVSFYESKASELEKGQAEGMGYTNGDPIRSLRDKAREHDEKVKLFTWMRDHVAASGETYQLADVDLQRIEILGRVW